MVVNITLHLKKELKTKAKIFGSKRTLKFLKTKDPGIEKIYISGDCPEIIRSEISELAEKQKIEVIFLDFSKEELKDICKKPFNISIVSIFSGKEIKPLEKETKKEKDKEKSKKTEKKKVRKTKTREEARKKTKKSKEKKK